MQKLNIKPTSLIMLASLLTLQCAPAYAVSSMDNKKPETVIGVQNQVIFQKPASMLNDTETVKLDSAAIASIRNTLQLEGNGLDTIEAKATAINELAGFIPVDRESGNRNETAIQTVLQATSFDMNGFIAAAKEVIDNKSVSADGIAWIGAALANLASSHLSQMSASTVNEIVTTISNWAKDGTNLSQNRSAIMQEWLFKSMGELLKNLNTSTFSDGELSQLKAHFTDIFNAMPGLTPDVKAALKEFFRNDVLAALQSNDRMTMKALVNEILTRM